MKMQEKNISLGDGLFDEEDDEFSNFEDLIEKKN
jgi:hypothetical protein